MHESCSLEENCLENIKVLKQVVKRDEEVTMNLEGQLHKIKH